MMQFGGAKQPEVVNVSHACTAVSQFCRHHATTLSSTPSLASLAASSSNSRERDSQHKDRDLKTPKPSPVAAAKWAQGLESRV